MRGYRKVPLPIKKERKTYNLLTLEISLAGVLRRQPKILLSPWLFMSRQSCCMVRICRSFLPRNQNFVVSFIDCQCATIIQWVQYKKLKTSSSSRSSSSKQLFLSSLNLSLGFGCQGCNGWHEAGRDLHTIRHREDWQHAREASNCIFRLWLKKRRILI